jgi:small subunit ribosomal protein S6
MRPYEVMVIFDVGLEEADIRSKVDRVLETVKGRGGTPGAVDYWGRRTFAYELKHRTEGYYVLIEATAEPDVLAEVHRQLALEDAVLRHKVIRQPEQAAGRQPRRRPAAPPAPEAADAAQAS